LVRQCTSCNNPLRQEDSFCPHCGTKSSAHLSPTPIWQNADTPPTGTYQAPQYRPINATPQAKPDYVAMAIVSGLNIMGLVTLLDHGMNTTTTIMWIVALVLSIGLIFKSPPSNRVSGWIGTLFGAGLLLGTLVMTLRGSSETPPVGTVRPIQAQSSPAMRSNYQQAPSGVTLNGVASVITLPAKDKMTGLPYVDNNHPMHNLILQNNTAYEWRNVRVTINPGYASYSAACANIAPGQQALIEIPEFATTTGLRLDDNMTKIMRVHVNADTSQGSGEGDLRLLDYLGINVPDPPGVTHENTPPLIWTDPNAGAGKDDTYKIQQEQPKMQFNPDGSIKTGGGQ